MAGPVDLHDLALELLTACEDALATLPLLSPTYEGVPDRSFVTAGQPAADCCPQLTVHVEQIVDAPTSLGLDEGTRHRSARLPRPLLVVTLFRCVPGPRSDGTPPPVDELEEAAVQINADGWVLHNELYNALYGDPVTLFENCKNVVWEGLRRYGPQGMCGGWTLGVRVELDGYQS